MYGLKRESILNSLRYFHVTSGIPPDIMHDVLEGALQVEMKCLLDVLIHRERYFALATLNERIRSFPYGSDVTDHPKPIPSGFSTSASANGVKQCGKLILHTLISRN